MSFYGNVFYEFKNLFQKFKFLNNGKDNQSVDLPYNNSTTNGTTATQNWDTLHIETGNRWIGLKTLPETGDFKGVTIFHATPGDKTTDKATFTPVEGDDGEKLNADQKFTTAIFKVDNAGHIYDVQERAYQLPSSADMVNAGLNDNHDDGLGKDVLMASGEDDNSDYVELTPGQEIDVLRFTVSKKGIIETFSTKKYKLPMSDTEKDYSEMQERMGKAESTLEELVTSIPETYATINKVGIIDDVYNPDSSQTEYFASITKAIGNLEASSAAISGENTRVYSAADQLTAMNQLIKDTQAIVATYSTAIEGLGLKIEALTNRVKVLEEKLNSIE